MNILITGCLGHIGSFILPKLLRQKSHKIIGLDSNFNNNLNTIFNVKKKNFTFFLDDLKTFNYKKNIKKIEIIINLYLTTTSD